MPSKHNVRKARRGSPSGTASEDARRKTKRQGSKVESRRRRRSSSHSSFSRRRPRSSSCSSSRRKPKKLRPKRRSKSPGKPDGAKAERKPFDATSKPADPPKAPDKAASAPPTNGAKPADASPSATGSPPVVSPSGSPPAVPAEKRKLDLSSITELQKKLEEDRDRLQLFVIKAKQEHEEKRESKEKCEQREREYFKAEIGMPCGPDNRFLLEAELGKGVFSTVYRGRDMGFKGKDFAIKFIRANAMCRRATEKEVKLMRKLRNQASVLDPEGARCLLGLDGKEQFEHEGHLAVVLPLMKCDLRIGLRKYGQGHGLPLPYVMTFARDIFLALRALRMIKVVHTDLKPDNLLISLDRTSVRLSDFGSAMDTTQAGQVHTEYLQPRFYRAPEVIMGQPYTTQIDMWSAGATVFELATDRPLFRGETNNGMLHAMLKVRGPFPKALATSGKFASKHFAENGDFMLKDKGNTSIETVAMSTFAKPSPSVQQLLEESFAKRPDVGSLDAKIRGSLRHLAELIGKCCAPDPAERATPKVALELPFFEKADKK